MKIFILLLCFSWRFVIFKVNEVDDCGFLESGWFSGVELFNGIRIIL